jgi:O-antigen/teichoic acid export membrane protein
MTWTKSGFSQTVASSWISLVVTSACQLITIPIALSALNKADFALYAVITQMLMAVMLAQLGVNSACARLLIDARSKGTAAYDRMWNAAAMVFCLQAAVTLLLIVGLAPFIGELFHLDEEQVRTARWIFIAIGLINTLNYALSIFATGFFAGQRLTQLNLLTSVSSLVQLGGFYVAIKAGAGLWSYPIGMIATIIFAQPMIVGRAFKYGFVGHMSLSRLDWNDVKTMFRLGFDVFFAAIFSMVMGNSLLIFSGHLLTLDQTAVLAINLKLVSLMTNIFQRIPGSADPILMKMVSDGEKEQFRQWWALVTKSTVSLSLFGAGMFVIWNQFIVNHWTGKEMILPMAAAILLALIPFRYIVHYQFVNSLTIFKEIRRVKLMLGWEILLYSALAYSLGHRFGLNGLLAANLLSMCGGALLGGIKWFSAFSGIPIRLQSLLLFKATVPLALTFAVIAWLCAPYFNGRWLTSVSLTIAWTLSYALIGYSVILDDRERHGILGMAGNLARRVI